MKFAVRTFALLLLFASAARADLPGCPPSLFEPDGAEPTYRHSLTLSPFTYHWHYAADHKPVRLLGYDEHIKGGYFCGISVFSNSFGQPSVTAYVGKTWDNFWPEQPAVYGKLAAGLMYGYKGQYKNKVPLNVGGFSPLVAPSLGYRFTPKDAAELVVLGNSALMFSYVRRY